MNNEPDLVSSKEISRKEVERSEDMERQTAQNRTLQDPIEQKLYMAFELSEKKWKLGFTIGPGQRPRVRTIAVRNLEKLKQEIEAAKRRFGLPGTVPVMSCYEAGRDGFWLDRYLKAERIENLVVDSASIEVSRRARNPKTDKIDAGKLLGMLMRYDLGERKVWRVVNVPSAEAEDKRQLHRELRQMKSERTSHTNRIKGLLACQGVCMVVGKDFLERVKAMRLWNGNPLPSSLRGRLEREYERVQFLNQQIAELEAQRQDALRNSPDPDVQMVRRLMRLKGLGVNSAWLYVMEFFAWRAFRNRREVGALAGLVATPYNSGSSHHDQGISKAGNRHVRAMAIEIAWTWLRCQPNSELSQWYEKRFGQGSKRIRKIGIVALARKLLIELWRYLETGALPNGAELKP
jgi:transposase